MPSPDAVRVNCVCGYQLVAVLPAAKPKGPRARAAKVPMVAWSVRGEPAEQCPQCKRALPKISVTRFKDLVAGDCEIDLASC